MARYIGIDTHDNFIYEGNCPYGRAAWPTPVVIPATISPDNGGLLIAAQPGDAMHVECQFREDHYDPVSRIRRGRFYFREGGSVQPREWGQLEPHPAVPSEAPHVKLRKILATFVKQPIWHKYVRNAQELPLVLLGVEDRYTVWKLVNLEVTAAGDELVTLRARNSFGILPKLIPEKVPEPLRPKLNSSLGAFVDDVHRAAPLSIIDRARDAICYALICYFNMSGDAADDLGKLVAALENEPKERLKVIAIAAAKIVQRLHARGKPVEQERRRAPSIHEDDAELAAQCVGSVLVELGLAQRA